MHVDVDPTPVSFAATAPRTTSSDAVRVASGRIPTAISPGRIGEVASRTGHRGRHRLRRRRMLGRVGLIPPVIERDQRNSRKAVEDDAERNGDDHGRQHDLAVGTPISSASSANTREASPRGPNQPMKATVGRFTPWPARAIATGTMRTTVKLSTA